MADRRPANDASITDLQTKLHLPTDFFKRLLDEDDWSFIIKLHALVEAACSDFLLHRLNEPALRKIVTRLELSNKSTGKMAFIKELDLLEEEYRSYISHLSEWRNNFVHNVSNCSASLPAILEKMDKDALKRFALAFAPAEQYMNRLKGLPSSNKKDKDKVQPDVLMARAKQDPKLHIWNGAFSLLNIISVMYDYNDDLLFHKALNFTGTFATDNDQELGF